MIKLARQPGSAKCVGANRRELTHSGQKATTLLTWWGVACCLMAAFNTHANGLVPPASIINPADQVVPVVDLGMLHCRICDHISHFPTLEKVLPDC